MDNFEQPDRPLPGAPWDHHEDYWRRTFNRPISFVYLIQAGDGPIKIGVAKDPRSRLRDLQTSHYEDLRILRVLPGDRYLEARCHKRAKHARIKGEWFNTRLMPEFLYWFEAEAERLIDHYERTGEKPQFGPRARKGAGMQSRFSTRGGLRQGLRVRPDEEAPVTVRFVDPATLRDEAA